ncbi:hypothetical protein [Pyrodictium occultum]|uniref:hypothetical protein n=1 Tax=Pyrodictium occultum TaxID=2309 RepID=UPI001443503C|nr:hypothetical protein [Pyrodictium occultum]
MQWAMELESPKITSTNVEPCRDTIAPCLMFNVRVEGFDAGRGIYIPVDGALYSDDEKFLTRIILDKVSFSGTSFPPQIIVDYGEKYPRDLKHTLILGGKALLDPKSINYIEERRRINKYHRVELKLKIRFIVLYSTVHHPDDI